MKKYLILFALLLSYSCLKAQRYEFTHLQVENGLSNNTVLCSLQDKQGFMWFGTKDGLDRFDGYTFKTFRNNPKDSNTIGNNVIRCLYRDNENRLWVGTEGGLFKYNAVNESFMHVPISAGNEIMDITGDDKGNLWFISGFVLHEFNLTSGHKRVFANKDFGVTSLCFNEGKLWLSTTNGLLEQYDDQKNTFKYHSLFNHSTHTSSLWVQKIVLVDKNTIAVGTSHQGLKIFQIPTAAYRDILNYNPDHTEMFVRDILFSEGKYWIGTEAGVYIYDPANGRSDLITKHYNDPYALSDNSVYTFCKDQEGGVWIGTYFGGINYFAKPYTPFERFFPETGGNSLSGNAVREICADQYHNIWIGTEDAGLNQLTLPNNQFKHYLPSASPSSISSSNIHGLLVSGDKLLIGTFENGLNVMDLRSKKIVQHYTHTNTAVIKSNFFYCIYQTREGNILTGTTYGLYNFDLAHQSFTPEPAVPDNFFYTTLLEDHERTRWIGSFHDGLYFFNPFTKKHGVFTYNNADTLSISDNHINKLYEDSEQHLWIATENGLCKLNADNKTFTRYTSANGLPSNIIYAMLEDAHKNLWITTSKGLVCMDIGTKSTQVYTKANGLLSDQFNYNSAYKDADGNLYFGCLKGMIKFNPDHFINNHFTPPVYLTGFQVNNKELGINNGQSPLKRSIIYTDTITLNYTQSSFSIDFAALGFTSPQMTAYDYKMVGLDKDWVHLRSNRKVYFTKLAAAKYIFEVKVANAAGDKNITRLVIFVEPPFWLSKTALTLYLVIIAAAIYLTIKSYRAKTEKNNRRKAELFENEKEKELYNAKIAFFTHIAHEIRTPLTLIKGPMEKVIQQAGDLPLVQKNLRIMELNTNRLLNLTTQLLDFRKTEIKGFSLNFVKADIVKLLHDNIVVFEPIIKQRKLSLKTHFAAKQYWAYVDIEAFNKILSNLLNNAVKYAEKTVDVTLQLSGSNFCIVTANDGYLIPAEMKEKIFEPFFRIKEIEKISGTGIGLSLARSLAELHKGTLELSLQDNSVNTFILLLPVHHEIEFNLN